MSEVSSKTTTPRYINQPPVCDIHVFYPYVIELAYSTYTTNYSYKSVIILNVFKPKRVLYFVIVADLTCCPGYSEANDVYLVSVLPNKKEIMILCGIQHSEYKRLIKYTFCIY